MKSPSFFLNLAVMVLALASAAGGRAAEPLREERLREIIASPHSETPLVAALNIYPKAREYQITLQSKAPLGPASSTQSSATEKWVDGRYIVSQGQSPGTGERFDMVVEFDPDSKTYRKYMLLAGHLATCQAGTRQGKSRTVSWIDISPSNFASRADCLTTETYTDTSTSWLSQFYIRGTLVRTEIGRALVTK